MLFFNIVVNHYKKRSVSIRKARLRYVAMRLIIYPSITVEDLTPCRSHSRRKRRPRISCVTKTEVREIFTEKKKKKRKYRRSQKYSGLRKRVLFASVCSGMNGCIHPILVIISIKFFFLFFSFSFFNEMQLP